jgi:hypothetical protein
MRCLCCGRRRHSAPGLVTSRHFLWSAWSTLYTYRICSCKCMAEDACIRSTTSDPLCQPAVPISRFFLVQRVTALKRRFSSLCNSDASYDGFSLGQTLYINCSRPPITNVCSMQNFCATINTMDFVYPNSTPGAAGNGPPTEPNAAVERLEPC